MSEAQKLREAQPITAADVSGLAAPEPLPDGKPAVASLDPAMLPEAVRAYVFDVADRQQSPADFVAVAALVGLAGLLGRKLLVHPKRLDDWTVTANLWGALIGRPSMMKSPAMKAALAPLNAIEREERLAFEDAQAIHAAEARLVELRKKDMEGRARTLLKKGSPDEARALLREIERSEPPPTRPRIIVNDATVEKLGELLNENPNGLVLVRDELAGWLAKLSQEDHQQDRAFYLEAFNGDSPFRYDRIGRGTVDIPCCTISVIGGIQPSKLAPLVRGSIRGTSDDGMIQRHQLAVWPDDVGSWQWRDRAPDQRARDRYSEAFKRLHGLPLPEEEPPRLRLSDQAQGLFIEWMEELQAKARGSDLHPALESHLLKMPKTICALALLFEVLDGEADRVGQTAIARALDWGDYLESHARRIYSLASNPGAAGARLIHERRSKLPQPFSARDVHRRQWAGLDSIEAVREAIELLVDHRHVSPVELPTTAEGGRPRIVYYWHPALAPLES